MIEAKRILAAVALAAGATGLAAPMAAAAEGPTPLSVNGTIDDVATSAVAPEHRDEVPSVSGQLGKLNELRRVTDQVAPVTNLLTS
ncbi:hypothetical protein QIS99_30020 [Streptomyces sp. B-S-A8]|uniref:Secreted protein n=1 Tax=Streptomyces solicavernae TaxID=3043614 RepID=A0ABT6S158_9ACTN|nr:hypothetical protein [Streptomyces sp. B-S-A8]MDI3390397.1 hypothetical protein [Streptomyces sp. B-S-A8]